MRTRFSSGRAYSIVLPGHTSYGALATSDRRLAGVTLLKQQGAVGVKVKHWILEVANREALRAAVDLLGLDNVDRGSVKAMRSRLSRARRANLAVLLANLRVADVRRVCELQGLFPTGRKQALMERLLGHAEPGESRKPQAATVAAPRRGGWMRPSRRTSRRWVSGDR